MRQQSVKTADFSFHAHGANNNVFISSDEATILRQRKIFAPPGLTESLKGDGYETENAARTAYLLSALNTEDFPLRLVSARGIPTGNIQVEKRHEVFSVHISECSTGGTLEMPKIPHCDTHLSFANLLRVCLMAFDRHQAFLFDIHIKGNAVLTQDGKLYIIDPNASFALPPRGRRPSIGSISSVSFPFSYQSGCDDARDMVCWLWCLIGRHILAHNSYNIIPPLAVTSDEIKLKNFNVPSQSELDDMESLLGSIGNTYKKRTKLLWQLLFSAASEISAAQNLTVICFPKELCDLLREVNHVPGLSPTHNLSTELDNTQKNVVNKNPYYLQFASDEIKLYFLTQKPAYAVYNHFVDDDALRECSYRMRCRYMAVLRRSLRSYT